jgi:phage repressor protein C with HTH and peptisase S24 domain
VSKQQLSRLENGLIRLRLDQLKPFAKVLDYTPEQILLWGRYPGTTGDQIISEVLPASEQVAELASGSEANYSTLKKRRDGRHVDRVKSEGWIFPSSFVNNKLSTLSKQLVVVEAEGDSMAPTIMSGEKVIVDTDHKMLSPDGLYAIRDSFDKVIVRRLQLLRAAEPSRVKVISDNLKHPAEEVPLTDVEVVGKALCCFKLF